MAVKDYLSKLLVEGLKEEKIVEEETVVSLYEGAFKDLLMKIKELRQAGKKPCDIQKELKMTKDDWKALRDIMEEEGEPPFEDDEEDEEDLPMDEVCDKQTNESVTVSNMKLSDGAIVTLFVAKKKKKTVSPKFQKELEGMGLVDTDGNLTDKGSSLVSKPEVLKRITELSD